MKFVISSLLLTLLVARGRCETINNILGVRPIFGGLTQNLFGNNLAKFFGLFQSWTISPMYNICRNRYGGLDMGKIYRLENGQVYYFPAGEGLTFMDAKRYCENLGMQLVTFQNLKEANFVMEQLSRLYVASDNNDYSYSWIGLSSLNNPGQGDYRWLYSNAPIAFHAWDEAPLTEEDDCVYVDVSSQLDGTDWESESCDSTEQFICEIPDNCDAYVIASYQQFVGSPSG